ncbi:MAG TPA: kelch repeat-containing protein, partial [Thermoplasmata archaeon]|nr:kelch repeat-containing protein [Thermoplasmata archaeon]
MNYGTGLLAALLVALSASGTVLGIAPLPDGSLEHGPSPSTGATGEWKNVTPDTLPVARAGATLTFEPASDKLVLIGGATSGGSNETWATNASGFAPWEKRTAGPFAPRLYHTASFDPGARRIAVFGGKLDSGLATPQIWLYDPGNDSWEKTYPSTTPEARFSHAMTYDPGGRTHIMFGGGPFAGWLNDTWSFDMTTRNWTELAPSTAPSPRGFAAIASDPIGGEIVLFGGRDISGPMNETWHYDRTRNAWELVNTTVYPPARWGHTLVSCVPCGSLLMFGGEDRAGRVLNDLWEYYSVNRTWRSYVTPPDIHGRHSHAAAVVPNRTRLFVFGGDVGNDLDGNLLMWDRAADIWGFSSGQFTPSPRFGLTIAFDASKDTWVLHGGSSAGGISAETWERKGDQDIWMRSSSMSGPGTRVNHAMVYVPTLNRTMLHGGTGGDNNTWFYEAGASIPWLAAFPQQFPSHRTHHSLVFHPDTNQVVLFGGAGCTRICGETWHYDVAANNWVNRTTSIAPPARYLHTMAYVPTLDRILMFGGTTGVGAFGDTWAYDVRNSSWLLLAPRNSPSARYGHTMVYDQGSRGVLIFGGTDAFGQSHAMWAYDSVAEWWGEVTPSTGPRSRLSAAAAYDPSRRTMLMFGGISGNYWDGETWLFSDGTPPDLPPRIIRTMPASDAVDVSPLMSVTVEFDIEMNASATSSAFFISPAVVGGASAVAGRIFSWSHAAPLEEETLYTVLMTTKAKSVAGIALQQTHIFGFTTGKLRVPRPPTVIDTDPSDGEKGVAANAVVQVTFDQEMEPKMTMRSFSIDPSPGNATLQVKGRNLTWRTSSNFSAGTDYIATVSTL